MAATNVFIGSIESLLNDMERLSETQNPDVIDSMISRLQCASDTTNQLMHRSTSNYTALSSLYQHLLVFLESWQNRAWRTNHCCSVSHTVNNRVAPDEEETQGKVGRPQMNVSGEQIECLRNIGFTCDAISVMLCISRSTLWLRCHQLGQRYSEISDEELDGIMRDVVAAYPNSGLTLLRGHLKRLGIIVQRERARLSMIRVDPINVCMRRMRVIQRRSYSVPGQNALWHVDGHHSLIR